MKTPTLEQLQAIVDTAMLRRPATLLLKNVRLVNVFTLEIECTHIVLAGEYFAAMGPEYADAPADQVIDVQNAFIVPGLIDGHLHIESSLVTPIEYAKAVVPRGVTGIVADPHEVANVAGVPAVQWMIDASANLPLEIWFAVPSSVPATKMETSGAHLSNDDIRHLLSHPMVVSVGELMSFPGFLDSDPVELDKVIAAAQVRKTSEGHAPGVSGMALQAYLGSGIQSDHESTTLAEGKAKLAAGCFLMIREGSATRNLEALLPLIDARYGDRIGLVTDDRLPHDLLSEGGVDFLVRKAISLGADPVFAIRAASFNNARHFQLARRGAVAPGFQADFSIMNDLHSFTATSVYSRGKCVADQGKLLGDTTHEHLVREILNTVVLPRLREEDFQIPADGDAALPVIEAISGQILTRAQYLVPTVENGLAVPDAKRDLSKLVCIERYGYEGRIAACLATGFGLQTGCLAGTIAHDHHNLLAITMSDADLIVAAKRLEAMGGGMIAVRDGEVLAELPLPICGLLSDLSLDQVRDAMNRLDQAAVELGCTIESPLMALSFLGLAVIPELRLTDYGIVDVRTGALV